MFAQSCKNNLPSFFSELIIVGNRIVRFKKLFTRKILKQAIATYDIFECISAFLKNTGSLDDFEAVSFLKRPIRVLSEVKLQVVFRIV